MKPRPNALSALPTWIRRIAAPIALVTFTFLEKRAAESPRSYPLKRLTLKTSKLNFEIKQYTFKEFNAKRPRVILRPWVTPPA
ncbi:hypothetical protein SY2F82_55990 [Streptomyces sp. Y2F8-2]|nr:hypothetical protein SY2F82_55990 [Streptomyces sp. Y2F8-2]